MSNKQVSTKGQIGLYEITQDKPTKVRIAGTKRFVKIRGIKPGTIEKLTELWIKRDIQVINDKTAGQTLKSMCKDPYFTIKEAVICVLNSWWKIILVYPIMWRIWAFIYEYEEYQMTDIIVESKKKLPLMPHWMNMAYSVDMRNDWKRMTNKEAGQYRAELFSAMKQASSKSLLNTEEQSGE